MTPLKLMSHSGDVLGAVIVPEPAWVLLTWNWRSSRPCRRSKHHEVG